MRDTSISECVSDGRTSDAERARAPILERKTLSGPERPFSSAPGGQDRAADWSAPAGLSALEVANIGR